MSQDRYFNNFPVINYSNTAAVDITKRIVFLNNVLKNPYLFYPYEIDSYERAEQFSYRYYSDQYKDWVVYLGNQVVDPYYEWYLDYETFKQFKYANDVQFEIRYTINFKGEDMKIPKQTTVKVYDKYEEELKAEPKYEKIKKRMESSGRVDNKIQILSNLMKAESLKLQI